MTSSAVELSWRWPSSAAVVSVTIRMASGLVAPASPSKGRAAGKVGRRRRTLTVHGLKARTRYAFAVFARDRNGRYSKRATVSVTTRPGPLRIATRSLASGIKGLFYLQVLSASGGVAPYTWTAAGLPSGLTVSRRGVIGGYPRSTRTRAVTLRLRDARHVSLRRTLRLRVPSSLPAGCIARSCAKLSPDGHTVQIPGRDITSVTRSSKSGKVTRVSLSGTSVARGDVLVLAPAAGIPSGLIAVVRSVSGGSGTSTVAVAPATPADAYHMGMVQAIGKPAAAAGALPAGGPDAGLSCKGGVTSSLHGLTVQPSLKPAVAMRWKHRLFGGRGVYLGYGGLNLFQFDLTGTIKVSLGVNVSGKALCKLRLPGITRAVPAGYLGAVILQLHPSLTLKTTAAADVRTSVTLTCDADYLWDRGKQTRADYCTATHRPLGLTAGSGIDATATGTIDVRASLDDLPGVVGTIDASLHAGYHPAQHPVAEVDARSDYDLKATIAAIWRGAPTLTIVDGTIFDKVLATYGRLPGSGGKPAIAVSPGEAIPWSDAVCGFNNPTFGSNRFTVKGRGFRPGELVSVSTGWRKYTRNSPTANSVGKFRAAELVGEVPSVFDEYFGVYADGNHGSRAATSIELDSDGCIDQSNSSAGISLQWGGNGFDPESTVYLGIDDATISSAATDSRGSGGSTAGFDCPSSGSYTWEVSGDDNGEPVDATGSMSCTPAAGTGTGRPVRTNGRAAAATTR